MGGAYSPFVLNCTGNWSDYFTHVTCPITTHLGLWINTNKILIVHVESVEWGTVPVIHSRLCPSKKQNDWKTFLLCNIFLFWNLRQKLFPSGTFHLFWFHPFGQTGETLNTECLLMQCNTGKSTKCFHCGKETFTCDFHVGKTQKSTSRSGLPNGMKWELKRRASLPV